MATSPALLLALPLFVLLSLPSPASATDSVSRRPRIVVYGGGRQAEPAGAAAASDADAASPDDNGSELVELSEIDGAGTEPQDGAQSPADFTWQETEAPDGDNATTPIPSTAIPPTQAPPTRAPPTDAPAPPGPRFSHAVRLDVSALVLPGAAARFPLAPRELEILEEAFLQGVLSRMWQLERRLEELANTTAAEGGQQQRGEAATQGTTECFSLTPSISRNATASAYMLNLTYVDKAEDASGAASCLEVFVRTEMVLRSHAPHKKLCPAAQEVLDSPWEAFKDVLLGGLTTACGDAKMTWIGLSRVAEDVVKGVVGGVGDSRSRLSDVAEAAAVPGGTVFAFAPATAELVDIGIHSKERSQIAADFHRGLVSMVALPPGLCTASVRRQLQVGPLYPTEVSLCFTEDEVEARGGGLGQASVVAAVRDILHGVVKPMIPNINFVTRFSDLNISSLCARQDGANGTLSTAPATRTYLASCSRSLYLPVEECYMNNGADDVSSGGRVSSILSALRADEEMDAAAGTACSKVPRRLAEAAGGTPAPKTSNSSAGGSGVNATETGSQRYVTVQVSVNVPEVMMHTTGQRDSYVCTGLASYMDSCIRLNAQDFVFTDSPVTVNAERPASSSGNTVAIAAGAATGAAVLLLLVVAVLLRKRIGHWARSRGGCVGAAARLLTGSSDGGGGGRKKHPSSEHEPDGTSQNHTRPEASEGVDGVLHSPDEESWIVVNGDPYMPTYATVEAAKRETKWEALSDAGRTYYHNRDTGQTRWSTPTELRDDSEPLATETHTVTNATESDPCANRPDSLPDNGTFAAENDAAAAANAAANAAAAARHMSPDYSPEEVPAHPLMRPEFFRGRVSDNSAAVGVATAAMPDLQLPSSSPLSPRSPRSLRSASEATPTPRAPVPEPELVSEPARQSSGSVGARTIITTPRDTTPSGCDLEV
eukprot:Rhum_TRINITY_DN15571_c0_g1::Rhum_TRINITY_DN15571_c0_g1_i1::g.161296::m.161296